MKWRNWIATGVLIITLSLSGTAKAVNNDVDATHDARTEGYTAPVQVEGSTSMLWIIFVFISIFAMSALFKDSRRARTE